MDKEFTDKEIERLDFITDKVQSFINEILPDGKKISADNDLIDDVICSIWNCIKDKNICTENDFYPFRDTEPNGKKKFTVHMEVKSVVNKDVYASDFYEAYERANSLGISQRELNDAEITEETVVSAEDTETGEVLDYAN